MIDMRLLIAIIVSLLAWTSGNVIDKFIISKRSTNNYTYTFTSVSILFVESIILSFFLDWNGVGLGNLWLPFIAGLISGFSFITYYYLLSKEEASQILPHFNLSPIGLVLIHVFILGSSFTSVQLFGIGIAVFGAVVLESHNNLRTLFREKTALIGICYGLLIAVPIAIVEYASHSLPYLNIQLPFSIGVVITVSTLLLRKDVRKTLFKHYKFYPYTIASEACGMTGNLSFWYGLAFVSSPLLTGITAVQPLVLFGVVTFISRFYPGVVKEDLTRKTLLRKLVGILFIVVGTGIISYTIS